MVYDPACGSGEFLREALRQLHMKGYRGHVHLIGSDTSDAACAMSRFVLAREQRHVQSKVTFDIRREDALNAGTCWPEGVHLLLMNPPFVSWQDMDEQTREGVQRILGGLYKKRPDMASAFLLRASEALAPEGVLGTVLPASLLDGVSFEPLRAELSARLQHRFIGRLGSHTVFSKAQVDAAVYVGVRGGAGRRPPMLLWADYRFKSFSDALRALRIHGDAPVEGDGFSVYPVSASRITRADWAPRPLKAFKLIERLRNYPTVGMIFDVKQGALTGRNAATILTQEEWKDLPAGERKFFRPAVMNVSLKNGALSKNYYVFYPYGESVPQINSEEDLAGYLPKYYKRKLAVDREILRSRARAKESQWWKLSEHRAWQVARQSKIVSTYFGRPGSFGWDAGGDYVVVQGYGWLARETWLAKHRLSLSDFNERFASAYLAVLNAPVVDALLAGVSNNVGGGQWNLSKRFVSRMPLPDLFAEGVDMGLLDELTRIGTAMVRRMAYDKDRHGELVAGIYGTDNTPG
jgi:hypothetical protein